jgi:hypothetical protein
MLTCYHDIALDVGMSSKTNPVTYIDDTEHKPCSSDLSGMPGRDIVGSAHT